jgi:RimJ/RimL family protein N-acetyltransferase
MTKLMHLLLSTTLLRKLEPEDAPNLYQFRNEPRVINGLGGFSSGYSLQAIREWIERRGRASHDLVWAIADRETNSCLGHAGLYQIDHRVRACEFGILIGDSSRWGKGIGKEVTSTIVAYGFDELNMNRIELSVIASNPRAIRLYEGLGFGREGLRRQAQYRAGEYLDVILMSILRSERTRLKGALDVV